MRLSCRALLLFAVLHFLFKPFRYWMREERMADNFMFYLQFRPVRMLPAELLLSDTPIEHAHLKCEIYPLLACQKGLHQR